MKRALLAATAAALSSAAAGQSVPAIPFDSTPEPLMLPADLYFGEVTGVSVNSKGMVYVLSRGNTSGPAYAAAATQLLEFGADGKFIREIDKNGRWLKSWGDRGRKPGEFNTPHSIAADAKGNIYVADRGNRRIQVFDGEGNFQREIRIDVPFDKSAQPAIGAVPDLVKLEGSGAPLTMAPGAPWAVCITPGPNQVLYTSDAYPGRVYKLSLDGKVLGVLGESGKQLKQFGWIHEIACPSENVLYVAELLNWRVQKLMLRPR